jgi:hypothetical protein
MMEGELIAEKLWFGWNRRFSAALKFWLRQRA